MRNSKPSYLVFFRVNRNKFGLRYLTTEVIHRISGHWLEVGLHPPSPPTHIVLTFSPPHLILTQWLCELVLLNS